MPRMHKLVFPLEVKLASPDTETIVREIEGYGAIFGNTDFNGDMIAKGAFAETLKISKKTGTWPAMLSQHGGGLFFGDDTPVGIWTEIHEDDRGLYVKGVLADTPRGHEIYTLLKMARPALNGLSIGFRPLEWQRGKEVGPGATDPLGPRRVLTKIQLMEISFVTFPANTQARITGVKGEGSEVLTIRDAEEALRDAGFSRNEAKAILAGGYKQAATDQRDAEEEVSELSAILQKNIALFKPQQKV